MKRVIENLKNSIISISKKGISIESSNNKIDLSLKIKNKELEIPVYKIDKDLKIDK